MHSRTKTAAGSLALVLILGACGGSGDLSSKSPDEILNDTRVIADKANSVHITGSLNQEGSKSTIDIVLTNSGDGKDELTSDGQTVSIIKTGGTIYAKGLSGTAGPGYQKLAADDPRLTQVSQSLDKAVFLHQVLSTDKKFQPAGKGKVGDRDTVKLATESGESILQVADNADNPYPMQIESTGPLAISITFSGWDEDVKIAPPQVGN